MCVCACVCGSVRGNESRTAYSNCAFVFVFILSSTRWHCFCSLHSTPVYSHCVWIWKLYINNIGFALPLPNNSLFPASRDLTWSFPLCNVRCLYCRSPPILQGVYLSLSVTKLIPSHCQNRTERNESLVSTGTDITHSTSTERQAERHRPKSIHLSNCFTAGRVLQIFDNVSSLISQYLFAPWGVPPHQREK